MIIYLYSDISCPIMNAESYLTLSEIGQGRLGRMSLAYWSVKEEKQCLHRKRHVMDEFMWAYVVHIHVGLGLALKFREDPPEHLTRSHVLLFLLVCSVILHKVRLISLPKWEFFVLICLLPKVFYVLGQGLHNYILSDSWKLPIWHFSFFIHTIVWRLEVGCVVIFFGHFLIIWTIVDISRILVWNIENTQVKLCLEGWRCSVYYKQILAYQNLD